jgi:hypothetical protein
LDYQRALLKANLNNKHDYYGNPKMNTLIPVSDYDWAALLLKGKIDEEETYNNLNFTLKLEPSTILAKHIKTLIKPETIITSLCALDRDIDIKELMRSILYSVHCDPNAPYFHTMRRIDDNIAIYNRADDDNREPGWALYPVEIATRILNNHAKNLLMFTLNSGLEDAVEKYWISRKCGALCFQQHDIKIMIYEKNKNLKREITQDEDLIDCYAMALRIRIDARKREILKIWNDIYFSETEWAHFITQIEQAQKGL